MHNYFTKYDTPTCFDTIVSPLGSSDLVPCSVAPICQCIFIRHSPSWEANCFSAGQEISLFYGTRRFITAFTTARHIEDKKDVTSDRISTGLSVLETVECPYSQ